MRWYVLSIIFILLIPSVLAYELGISPTQITLEGKTNEQLCTNMTVISKDYNDSITVESKWASQGINDKDISLHTLTPDILKIKAEYLSTFTLNQRKQIELCLTAQDAGSFHGLMLFKTEKSNIEVGNWISLTIAQGENTPQGTIALTGSTISEIPSGGILILELTFSLILIVVFIFLLTMRKKK